MCGIVGYVGAHEAVSFLLPGLRSLEYRGYDSAGLATIDGGRLDVRKAAGRIETLESAIQPALPAGRLGIAHTRWATHGRPTDSNAHPHMDCGGRIAVVHNGIIENYRVLRKRLAEEGHRFRSQTDTEVIAHLVEKHRRNGLADAVRLAARDLRGSYAMACIADDAPDTIVAVRGGSSPLVIGLGDGELLLASDIPALLGRTREVLVVGEGEMAILRPGSVGIFTLEGAPVQRGTTAIPWNREAAEKGGYAHFMLKEIHEQPEAVRNTLSERLDVDDGDVRIPELGLGDQDLIALTRLCFVACGTSWHAALVGKYLVEAFARLPVDVDIASEFRYRENVLDSRMLTVPISQSGETADTLAALRAAREKGSRAVAVCNVVGASVAREADGVIYTRAGIEIGVASTKAFTTQLAAVTLLALRLGLARRMLEPEKARQVIKELWKVPRLMERMLEQEDAIREVAARFRAQRDFLYLGRNLLFPIALEGALKLKEISYIHAEGYAAGEMKHGPLALVDSSMPVVALAPPGPHHSKMLSNIEEVKARDGIVIVVGDPADPEIAPHADFLIPVPAVSPWIQPLITVLPLQLLAYHLGVLRGCDVDRPRNLAKSVTVE
jgi:glucosamine--fructose-6-phosphate aminotransferase (isomerizing)